MNTRTMKTKSLNIEIAAHLGRSVETQIAIFQKAHKNLEPTLKALAPFIDDLKKTQSTFKLALPTYHDPVDPQFAQKASDHARRVFQIAQSISEIGLDLSRYGDVDFAEVIFVIFKARPCEYKELLDHHFLKESARDELSAKPQPNKVQSPSLDDLKEFLAFLFLLLSCLNEAGDFVDRINPTINACIEQKHKSERPNESDFPSGGEASVDGRKSNHQAERI